MAPDIPAHSGLPGEARDDQAAMNNKMPSPGRQVSGMARAR
ncbi:hypothetical protein ACTXG6_08440 [Pseudonocardia sp. Cha107L01]